MVQMLHARNIEIILNWFSLFTCLLPLFTFTTFSNCLPAARASLQASYMSCLISGLSSPILSATETNRSIAKFTDCPTRPIDRIAFSVAADKAVDPCEVACSDRCCTNVEICTKRFHTVYNKVIYRASYK